MDACAVHLRRRLPFWTLVIALTAVITLEPALFLVGLSLALSAVTLTWIVMLAKLLLVDALARDPSASCP